jgi:GT2 family glycosyltransferase
LFQVVQLDWNPVEGPAPFCGGAAMWRRDVFEQAGGFPEDVQYGEEPLLCWRVRNKLGRQIYCLGHVMARHDLGFRGGWDYLRQYVRNGRSYAEITERCIESDDPMWLHEVLSNYAWGAAMVLAFILLLLGSTPIRTGIALLAAALWLRKTVQTARKGHTWTIAAGYAVHVYLSKLPLAFGQLRWVLERAMRGKPAQRKV